MPNGYRNREGDFVSRKGSEIIGGLKIFTTFPLTPEQNPTDYYQVANKAYVDAIPAYIEFGPGTAGAVGNWRLYESGGSCYLQKCTAANWATYDTHATFP